MHIDDLRIALFNFIVASQQGEKLHIRIEDLEQVPQIEERVQEVVELLALFGVSFSELSYQSHNLKFHQQLATKLLMDKNAFSCFCTKEEIDAKKEASAKADKLYQYDDNCRFLSDEEVLNDERPFSIRIKRPDEDINFEDIIQGKIAFKKEQIDSFMILHTDKTPTQNFATAIDDLLSDITMVIQTTSHLKNSPKEILIRHYLGYDKEVKYAHLPTILPNQESTQEDIYSLKWLLEEGFLPSAIVNYLIMIGNQTPSEIFTLQEAIAWFDLSHLSTTAVTFDISLLKKINQAHIQKMPALELAKFIGYSSKDLGELAKIYAEEGSTINEIKPKIDAIFAKKEPSKFTEEFQTLSMIAKKAPFFKVYDDFEAYLIQESGLPQKQLLIPLRFLLTGEEKGPELREIYKHIKNYLGEIIK
jgi:glutamyl-tRNA synthetase